MIGGATLFKVSYVRNAATKTAWGSFCNELVPGDKFLFSKRFSMSDCWHVCFNIKIKLIFYAF